MNGPFQITVELDKDTWQALQAQAHGAGISPTDVVRACLNGWRKLHDESLCASLARQRNKALDDLAQVEAGRAVIMVQLQEMTSARDKLTERWGSLYEAIAHGGEEHRAWLRQALADHLECRAVAPPPTSPAD
jgi:hypothetical protein